MSEHAVQDLQGGVPGSYDLVGGKHRWRVYEFQGSTRGGIVGAASASLGEGDRGREAIPGVYLGGVHGEGRCWSGCVDENSCWRETSVGGTVLRISYGVMDGVVVR